jgi:hypothetical protein
LIEIDCDLLYWKYKGYQRIHEVEYQGLELESIISGNDLYTVQKVWGKGFSLEKRGAEKSLHRITIIVAIVFSCALAYPLIAR